MQTQPAPQSRNVDSFCESPHVQEQAHAAGSTAATLLALASTLAACGGGGGGGASTAPLGANEALLQNFSGLPGSGGTAPAVAATPASKRDASRFLTQATFGIRSVTEIDELRSKGFERWLWEQFNQPTMSHLSYLAAQRTREEENRVTEEMSYEAIWQQWLTGTDLLRARVSWALLQFFVISNIAPDIRPHAMSSYMDMLNKNAFGNFRQLLEEVTLHPAMGYYLNMLESEKEDPKQGTHPNENYAREVMQLFTIGLVKLNMNGSVQTNAQGQPIPTYDETVVKGFAQAFTGWSYGGLDNTKNNLFHDHDDNEEGLWIVPMKPWAAFHSPGPKTLLDGRVLPAGQSPQQDLKDALDTLFNHPNVPPFFCRQMIQRLVTSNPSGDYIRRVATVFANNGSGVRGDLRAVFSAILLDPEARGDNAATRPRFGKQREPVVRFATFLRALGAKSKNGINNIHYLDSADNALGQSPMLAPSVFNFYSPNYRPTGPAAQAGLVAPEFQITSETTVVGSLNFFSSIFSSMGYGWGDSRLELDISSLSALAGDAAALVSRIDLLFFCEQMSTATRDRMTRMVGSMSANNKDGRVKAALLLTAMSSDFVIQK
jgi:uncharacterized protein (DUF1800 family)